MNALVGLCYSFLSEVLKSEVNMSLSYIFYWLLCSFSIQTLKSLIKGQETTTEGYFPFIYGQNLDQ